MPTAALITYQQSPTLTRSDTLLATALQARGWHATPAAWDDPAVDWTAFDVVILRACWNYHTQPVEFRAWLARLEAARVPTWNTPDLVRWNMQKTYMRDLSAHGVNVVPTLWVQRGDAVNLAVLLYREGWAQAVVKPQVSASAWQTWVVTPTEAAARQPDLDAMLATGDVMIQPLIPGIHNGEWSLIFFNGAYSHTVLKRPGAGNIFVQADLGGTWEPADPPPGAIQESRAILGTAPGRWPLYARVDIVLDHGSLLLMELELIEPELFLDEAAAGRFADALLARIAPQEEV